jgi:NADH-quinone oxidoreductase subunit L
MAIALVVLAVGAALGGYVGLPASLGGSDRFATFLEPSFTAGPPEAASAGAPQRIDALSARLGLTADMTPAEIETRLARVQDERTAAAGEATEGLELGLMAVSSLAAIGGLAIAFFLFLQRRDAARALAERFSGAHRLMAANYYVDDIYNAAVVQPIKIASTEGLWKIVDVQVIDGLVNGVGELVSGSSEILRRLQTGSVRAYAASLFFGVVAILGYYLWR